MNYQKFVNQLNGVKNMGMDGILSIDFDVFHEQPRVHVSKDYFEEMADELDAQPEKYGRDMAHDVELVFEKNGIEFFTLMTESDYEADFRSWVENEVTDEEFINSPLTISAELTDRGLQMKRDFL